MKNNTIISNIIKVRRGTAYLLLLTQLLLSCAGSQSVLLPDSQSNSVAPTPSTSLPGPTLLPEVETPATSSTEAGPYYQGLPSSGYRGNSSVAEILE